MKIFTGNFANVKKYQAKGYVCISIARFNKYWNGPQMIELSPFPDMLYLSEKEYVPKFMRILATLSAIEIVQTIRKFANGNDAVLLCYEKEGDFCHRRLVAEWLKKEVGEEVRELGDMKPKSNQQSLFLCLLVRPLRKR